MELGWLEPVLDLVSDIGTNIANWFGIKNTNDTNREIHQSDQDFQAAQTQAAWERDDTAHQREVADLEAAGLSPLANTTGQNVTSPLGSASPIAMQAPQFSATTAINSMLQAKQLNETERHNKVQEGYEGLEYVNQCKELELKTKELDIQNKKVEADIKYQTQSLKNIADQLAETKKHNQEEEYQKQLEYLSKAYFEEIQQQTGGKYNYTDYYDLAEYEAAMKKWTQDYEKFIDSLEYTSKATAEAHGSGYSGNLSIGNQNLLQTSGGISDTQSDSGSSSENQSQRQQAMIDKFYHDHPMPVFHYYNPTSAKKRAD